MTAPLVVAYGLGVDSTAALVGMAARGLRPDLILFADTGGEKPETYAYLSVIQGWLAERGWPLVEVVKYAPRHDRYTTLEGNCIANGTLPSLAFGRKGCSQKFKVEPQNKYVAKWQPARDAWARGERVTKVIGYDAGPADSRRSKIAEDDRYSYWYPLREWGWDRERCKSEIASAGLPIPMKSACFFCPATKPEELAWLVETHPDLADKIIDIETTAAPKNRTVTGLWRRATKTRPGSMSEFIASERARRLPVLADDSDCIDCGGV